MATVPLRDERKWAPIAAESDRASFAALQCVDLVTVFPHIRATHLFSHQAAIYVKGGD